MCVCVCVWGGGAYLPISPSAYVKLAMSCMCVCAYLPISPSAYVRLAMSCMSVCGGGGGDGGVVGGCLSPHFSLCLSKTGYEQYVNQPVIHPVGDVVVIANFNRTLHIFAAELWTGYTMHC